MKLKQMISSLAAATLVVSSISIGAAAASTKPIAIKSAKDLMSMKSNGDYYLANDIDLAKVKWKPISNFSGSFDGKNHQIENLRSSGYGLFSSLKSGAEVKNVIMSDVYIDSRYKSVGAVASVISHNEKNVTVENCSVSGVVASCLTKYKTGGADRISTAGAIVGVNNSPSSVVKDCFSNAVVAAENICGGIVGQNVGTISVSGFDGTLANSYNIPELRCKPGQACTDDAAMGGTYGGICGLNKGKITSCFNDCLVPNEGFSGGIVGQMDSGSVSKCVNTALIAAGYPENGDAVGLIVGKMASKASLSDCYTIKPTTDSAQNDVGAGKTGTKTYGVSKQNFGKLSSFKRLVGDWFIDSTNKPFLDVLSYNTIPENKWFYYGEQLKKTNYYSTGRGLLYDE